MLENNQNLVLTVENVKGYIDEDGTAWLNLEDVSRGLGFTETKNGKDYVMWRRVYQYLREFSFGTSAEENNSQLVNQNTYIPEEIFYRLAMKANNEVANRFQIKIACDILPKLRKEGFYSLKQDSYLIEDSIERAKRWIEEEQERRRLAEQNKMLLPKAEHYDTVMESEKLLDMKDTAKALDFVKVEIITDKRGKQRLKIKPVGRNNLFEVLREGGVLLKDNTPKQKFVDSGYFKIVETTVTRKEQTLVFSTTYVKQKGLDFIRRFLLKNGFIPRKDVEDYWNEEDLQLIKEEIKDKC